MDYRLLSTRSFIKHIVPEHWTLLTLITFLVCGLVIIKTEGTHASLTEQTVHAPEKRPPNERKLIKSTWRNEPLKVSKVKVKKGAIELGRMFTDEKLEKRKEMPRPPTSFRLSLISHLR